MVSITQKDNEFHFNIEGLHKLWTLKSELTIPIENVVRAYKDLSELDSWKGWKLPGTHIPGIITAGTFYKEGDKIFWDVTDKDHTIIIELEDENYHKLIIDVEHPQETIDMINNALRLV